MTVQEQGNDLVAQIKELTARVELLSTVREITALRHALPRRINENRWDEVGELFSENARLDYAHLGQAAGREEIQRYFSGLPAMIEENSPAAHVMVKQFVHAHDVEVQAETATGVSFFEEKVVFDSESSFVAGKFTDAYAREHGRWLFSHIRLELFWVIPYQRGWER
ncbi:nuclear transport factor 2 family protein [Frankia sp. AgB32]|uniref:nuclear transport factor 2 family protein n=1 Tax=Frankia sp. AgB32 TaxID=631119 RepID=UPI002010A212|nr:nuclear transport factor 2 family protein [Frankia sp. AgB32]MCK9895432.1 nuclear transport factor 2 family protein [Frankia sp. AgB32]